MTKSERITIGELFEHLKMFDKNCELIFGSDELTFFRTKGRGEGVVQIEFNQQILNGQIINLKD